MNRYRYRRALPSRYSGRSNSAGQMNNNIKIGILTADYPKDRSVRADTVGQSIHKPCYLRIDMSANDGYWITMIFRSAGFSCLNCAAIPTRKPSGLIRSVSIKKGLRLAVLPPKFCLLSQSKRMEYAAPWSKS